MASEARAGDAPVVVVGAGVAGLAAAAAIRRAGLGCLVLEASGRIGGRAWTTHPPALSGDPFDHGAFLLHMAERNPLVPMARAAGEHLADIAETSTSRTFIGARPATAAELAAYDAAEQRFHETLGARAAAEPDISLAEAARALDDPWTETLLAWEGTLISAADPRDFSLRSWKNEMLSGGNLLVEGGLGAFIARVLGPRAGPVRLDAPVTRIAWQEAGGVRVETPHGTIAARCCIVTVSTGVLAAGGIRFDPPLPAATREAIAALPMGLLTKIALPATGADRLDLPPSCSVDRRIGAGEALMTLRAWPFGRPHVICFVGGPKAWELAGSDQAAEGFAREELRRRFGARADRALGGPAVVTRWGTDPCFLGAYAYARVGQPGAGRRLSEPLADGRLIFAGEACHQGMAGTVAGAFLSGEAAARTAIQAARGAA